VQSLEGVFWFSQRRRGAKFDIFLGACRGAETQRVQAQSLEDVIWFTQRRRDAKIDGCQLILAKTQRRRGCKRRVGRMLFGSRKGAEARRLMDAN